MTIDDEAPLEQDWDAEIDDETVEPDAESDAVQYGYIGFTLRELIIVGVWFVAFVVSFFPLHWGTHPSLWGLGLQWIVPIGVPTVAVFLLVLRRLSPDGIRRVGTLSIDQFASVAFSVAVAYWIPVLWDSVAAMIEFGAGASWVFWVEAVLMLVLVAVTVFAPLIPGLRDDFDGRPETLAHRAANPIRPVVPRPRREVAHPVIAAPSDQEPIVAEEDAEAAPQPFWVLAPTERDIVDEAGFSVFRIGPTAWALVIEEREDALLVRHEDGRTGLLLEFSDITKG